jgi:hypothetical protein
MWALLYGDLEGDSVKTGNGVEDHDGTAGRGGPYVSFLGSMNIIY